MYIPCAQFINAGEGNLRHGEPLPVCRINKINIAELVSGKNSSANLLDVCVKAVLAACDLVEAAASQLWARGRGVALEGHFVDFVAIGQQAEVVVLLDVSQDKITGPVNCTVAAAASIRKTDDPLDLWGLLPDQTNGFCNAVTFRIAGKVIIKGHAVKFQESVPGRAFHQADDFFLVQTGAIAQNAV